MSKAVFLIKVKVKVSQSCPTLCDPMDWAAYPFSRDLPNSGIEPGSPALQADSLPVELSG